MEGTTSINIDAKVEDKIADQLAQMALERLSEEELTTLVNNVIHDKFNAERKKSWDSSLSETDKIILRKYYSKLSDKIQTILETEDNEAKLEETAKRIINNSREAAEKYLTEAIAKRMCMMHTDFGGDWVKYDIMSFVNDVMNNHMTQDHGRSY